MIPLVWQFVLMGIFGGVCGGFLGWNMSRTKLLDDTERVRVQLAGCLTAAEGCAGPNPPKRGSWAWSPAFEAVMYLRANYDSVKKIAATYQDSAALQRAATPGPRETETTALFKTSAGQAIESPRTWDKRLEKFGGPTTIPYEELEGMFLDQFLLRYFYSLMPQEVFAYMTVGGWDNCAPWEGFVKRNPWAKEMPLLFEQMTGYTLNEIQLNNAIAEWARRLERLAHAGKPSLLNVLVAQSCDKSQRAATPGPRETERATTIECPECRKEVPIVASHCNWEICKSTVFFVDHLDSTGTATCEGSGHAVRLPGPAMSAPEPIKWQAKVQELRDLKYCSLCGCGHGPEHPHSQGVATPGPRETQNTQ